MHLDFDTTKLEELKSQVMAEYSLSKQSVEQKKQLFRDRQPLYSNINRDNLKINLHTIRWLIVTLLALYYEDELTVEFATRNIFTQDYAYNWNKIAEHDYDQHDMDIDDFINQKNRFIYWVWIRFFYGWDDELKTGLYDVINPMSRRPDPNWHTKPWNFQFMWFDRDVKVTEAVDAERQYNSDKLTVNLSSEEYLNKRAMKNGRLLDQQDWWGGSVKNPSYNWPITIYYHLTTFDDKTVQVAMFNGMILEVKHLEAVDNENINGKMGKIKWPIALNYYDPQEWDPFWISVVDLSEDKQKLKNLLINLMKDKAVRQALGGTMFVDNDTFASNKAEFTKKTLWPTYIPVTTPVEGWVQKLIYKVPEDNISSDVYNMPWIIDAELRSDVGIDDQLRGINAGSKWTATEAQITQQNQNINLVLGNRINGWGNKQFWSVMYLMYKYYFSDKDKKFVRYSSASSSKSMFVTRRQIIDDVDPDIVIENRSAMRIRHTEMANKMERQLPFMMQSPTIPEISKTLYHRKLLMLQGWDKNEIESRIVPLSPEEEAASEQILMLSRNIPITINDMSEDHLTFMIIYKNALDTPAKKAAIEMRRQAYINSGQQKLHKQQQQEAWQWMWWLANSIGNQVASAWIASEMRQWQSIAW